MKKLIITSIVLILTVNAWGQATKTLSGQLWERVDDCYSMFEDMDDDGKIDYDEIIDDSKNGYLKVAGSWPTCGCNCAKTVGAYKKQSGDYVFIEKSNWSCSWISSISASENIHSVFPGEIMSEGFFAKPVNGFNSKALFYIDIEIPRKGTDTRVWIDVIPFGMNVKSESVLSYSYSEGDIAECRILSSIRNIAANLHDAATLNYILSNEFGKISAADAEVINESIGDDGIMLKSKAELVDYLNELKNVYDLYNLIEHEFLVLGWDREKGRFFVKEKGARPQHLEFIEFLKQKSYWTPIC